MDRIILITHNTGHIKYCVYIIITARAELICGLGEMNEHVQTLISDIDLFLCNAAAVTARVVERTVSIALGPVVHTVGLVAAVELGQGSREVTSGRHEGQQRNENHTRDIGPFQTTVARRQRVRLHESGYTVHAGYLYTFYNETRSINRFIIIKIILLIIFFFFFLNAQKLRV